MFLVCRMLYIYTRLEEGHRQSWRHRVAKKISRHQLPLLLIYFLCLNIISWTIFYLVKDQDPKGKLTPKETTGYLVLSIINWLIESSIGIVFCALWKYFSNLSRQSSFQVSSKKLCLVNCAITCIIVLYFSASIIFELVDPVLTFYSIRNLGSKDWSNFFSQVYFIRFMLDFISCMLILCLMYRFDPSQKIIA